MSYGAACIWVVLIFLASIGFWHIAMGLIYPHWGALLDLRIARAKARIAEYEAALAGPPPSVERPPVDVHVGELIAAPRKDILPPPPVDLDDAPIFAAVPLTLPIGVDFGFNWLQPWTVETGAFPVLDTTTAADDGEPTPKARERFAAKTPRTRKVSVAVGEETRTVEAMLS